MMKRTGVVLVPALVVGSAGLAAAAGPFGLTRTVMPEMLGEDLWVQFVDSADVDGDGLVDYLIGTASRRDQDSVYSVAFREADGSLTYSDPLDLRGLIDADVRSRFADTDGDGTPEIIVMDNNDLVRIPIVGRTLGEPVISQVVFEPVSNGFLAPVIAAADFSNEGAEALAYFDGFSDLRVIWPDGVEEVFDVGILSAEMGPVADYNGDGLPDLIGFDDVADKVVMIPGTGKRSFGAPVATSVYGIGGTITDLDLDGSADYVVHGPGGNLYWYSKIGQNPGQTPLAIDAEGLQISGIAAGVQLELDGPMSLAVWVVRQGGLPSSQELVWWPDPLNGGEAPTTLGIPGEGFGGTVLFEARDENNDGENDLVVYGEVIDVFDVRSCSTPVDLGSSRESVRANTNFTDLVDLDDDGMDELVSVSLNHVTISAGGEGPDRDSQVIPIASGGWMSAAVERDGELVLVGSSAGGSSAGGSVWVLEENAGIWSEAQRLDLPAPAAPRGIAVADLDGDGVDEIAVTDSQSQALIFKFDAAGVLSQVGSVALSDSIALAAADVTGDGLPDLIGGDQDASSIVVLQNEGGLSFAALPSVAIDDWGYWIVATDLDEDGYQDVVTGYSHLAVLWGEGGGAFSAPQRLETPFDPAMTEIIATDLDNDGLKDLAMSANPTFGAGLSRVYLQTSLREFDGAGTPLPGARHAGVRAGDVNGDGAVDVVTVGGVYRDIHWGTPPACVADINNNCVVDFFDLSQFIQLFNVQSPAADLVEPFGVHNFFDVVYYMGAFNAGCP